MIRISIRKKLTLADGKDHLCIDAAVKRGECVAIFGKSGAGKTSLLRIIAGLLKPETGFISSDGEVWLDTEKKINLPVQKRKIGFVFQDLALFPNMTVLENLQYGVRGKSGGEQIDELLKMVNIEALANRKPDTLSGGQRQRVAICRALAAKPELLLLDEPFSSLDLDMRQHLRQDLLKLHRVLGMTTLLVTHDLADVYHLADKVMVIDQGSVIKVGKPDEVFHTENMHGTIQIQGEILQIRSNGEGYLAEILTGHTIIKIEITKEENNNLKPGMKVLICSGIFEPVIKILA